MLIHLHGTTDASVTNWELGFFSNFQYKTKQSVFFPPVWLGSGSKRQVEYWMQGRKTELSCRKQRRAVCPLITKANALDQVWLLQ